ncbi:MAG TPA: sugar phosphate isomerase/epimerase [Acidimicrobiales bacterium]|nr:sugar phosphate isomerase/epimerase [Acidimicrobiales bacterium]
MPQQRFSFGYHLNSWDLGGLPLEDGLHFLAKQGFRWTEALARDTFSNDFARRRMQTGFVDVPEITLDIDFMRRVALFSRIQAEDGLQISSLYMNVELINPNTWGRELDTMQAVARLLKGFGSPVLVLGGGPPAAPDHPHEPDEYVTFAARLGEIGAYCRDLGMWACYHPHLDCFVETREQLDHVMEHLDTSRAGLCIDPAHLVFSATDPVKVVRDYFDAVHYMHYKDTKLVPGLKGAQRYAAFCELGAGVVDLEGITAVLLERGYDSLAIIELDVSQKGAEESTIESISYIRDTLGLEINAPA